MVCTLFLNMLFHDTFKLFLKVKYCFMMNTWPLLNLSIEYLITLAFSSLQDKLVFENPQCGHVCYPTCPSCTHRLNWIITTSNTYHDRFISLEPDYELVRLKSFYVFRLHISNIILCHNMRNVTAIKTLIQIWKLFLFSTVHV